MTKIYDAEAQRRRTNPHPIARSQNLEIGPSPPYLIQVKINWRNLYGWIVMLGTWCAGVRCVCMYIVGLELYAGFLAM